MVEGYGALLTESEAVDPINCREMEELKEEAERTGRDQAKARSERHGRSGTWVREGGEPVRFLLMEVGKKGGDFAIHQRPYMENFFLSTMSMDERRSDRSRPQKKKRSQSWKTSPSGMDSEGTHVIYNEHGTAQRTSRPMASQEGGESRGRGYIFDVRVWDFLMDEQFQPGFFSRSLSGRLGSLQRERRPRTHG